MLIKDYAFTAAKQDIQLIAAIDAIAVSTATAFFDFLHLLESLLGSVFDKKFIGLAPLCINLPIFGILCVL